MDIVVIPFNFMELAPVEQAKIVPICLTRKDEGGNDIAWGWFEAVVKIQTPLRSLVKCLLYDVWRVSEVTDLAIQSVWVSRGNDLGHQPENCIYDQANSHALNLQAGTRSQRRGRTGTLDDLDESIRNRVLRDPINYDARYIAGVDFSRLSQRFEKEGRQDMSYMLDLFRDGRNWDEIGHLTNQSANTAQRRFWRWINRIVQSLEQPRRNAPTP